MREAAVTGRSGRCFAVEPPLAAAGTLVCVLCCFDDQDVVVAVMTVVVMMVMRWTRLTDNNNSLSGDDGRWEHLPICVPGAEAQFIARANAKDATHAERIAAVAERSVRAP